MTKWNLKRKLRLVREMRAYVKMRALPENGAYN